MQVVTFYINKGILILMVSILIFTSFVAQAKEENINKSVDIINKNIFILNTLSPFVEDEFEVIDSLNNWILEELIMLLKDKALNQELLQTIDNFTIKSKDNLIHIFSWNEHLGGTFKPIINIIAYTLPSGKLKAEILNSYAYIEEIINLRLDNEDTLKYLLLGTGVECSTCMFSEALLISISDTLLQDDFGLKIDYRMGNLHQFYFDTTSCLLNYEVTADDRSMGYHDIIEDNKDKEERIKGSYVFKGHTFEEVDPNWKGRYVKGKKEGEWICQENELHRENDANRDDEYTLLIKLNYTNDVLHGVQTKYYANGKLHSKYNYQYGILHGEAKEWYENGQIQSRKIYKNNTLINEKSWLSNGKVKK